jgi:hypothetical protein
LAWEDLSRNPPASKRIIQAGRQEIVTTLSQECLLRVISNLYQRATPDMGSRAKKVEAGKLSLLK